MPNRSQHILTVNVEDYYQVGAFRHLISYQEWERFEDRLKANLHTTLVLLERYGATATFFVSGWIAEKHPDIFAPIVSGGHEIASQGYYQQSIREIPPHTFRDDIRRSKQLVEAAIGRAVIGFRIGRDWIGPDDSWALDVIREEGFLYDASICPIGRQFADHPQSFFVTRGVTPDNDLIEIPISSTRISGYAIPFAGGNYLRQSPRWFTRRATERWVASGHPLVAYFHIWELDNKQPNITAAGMLQRVRHYRNLDLMQARVAALLERFEFTSVRDYLALQQETLRSPVHGKGTASQPRIDAFQAESVTSKPRDLTLIVPCYNEEASIPYLASTLAAFASRARDSINLSYVFVDDGSDDSTANLLEETFASREDVTIVRMPRNRGIAAAILAGVAEANSALVAVIDADCTFEPAQILHMLPMLTDDVSVVVASPFHSEGSIRHVPAWRLLLSRGAAFLYRQVMNNRLSSYTSCFRIYRREAIQELHIDNEGFCGVTEIIARLDLAGHRIVETPAVLQVRLLGNSKIRLFRVIVDHLVLVTRIFAARHLGIPM